MKPLKKCFLAARLKACPDGLW